jgi:hypothetical protein
MGKISKENKNVLRRKFQPQWHFKSRKDLNEELDFQRRNNPSTYLWLRRKEVLVGGKRVSVKNTSPYQDLKMAMRIDGKARSPRRQTHSVGTSDWVARETGGF